MGAEVEGVEGGEGRGGGDVGLGDAVLPGEAVLVPERPEEAEHERGGGEQVAEAAPDKLAGVGQAAVEAHDGEAAELHAGRGAGERGEERHVEAVKQVDHGRADDCVHSFERELPAERAEQPDKPHAGEAEEERVERAGPAAFGDTRDRNESGLRARAVVRGGREIEFWLDADFDPFSLMGGLCRSFARVLLLAQGQLPLVRVVEIEDGGRLGERQAGLRVVAAEASVPRAVLLEAAGDFDAPFGLGGFGGLAPFGAAPGKCARGYGFENFFVFGCPSTALRAFGGNFTKGAALAVVKQESATLRADVYHWSVLRCGGSSGTQAS